MIIKKGIAAILLGASLLSISSAVSAADGVNDTEATAAALTTGVPVKATIADRTDMDWYTYTNTDRLPRKVTVTLNSPTTQNYDFYYWIYKSDGTVQRGVRSAAGVGGTETFTLDNLYAGERISIRVNGNSYAFDSSNPYTLTLTAVAPW